MNRSHPDSNSFAERNFLYFPPGKHPLCVPLREYQMQLEHVLPDPRLRDARTSLSSVV